MRVLRALSSLLVTVTLIGCTSQSTAPGPAVLRDPSTEGQAERERSAVMQAAMTPLRGSPNGQLTANQLRTAQGLVDGSQRDATARYQTDTERERLMPIDEVLENAGITEISDRKVAKCSGGEQQRLRIAQALTRDPAILLCDEPLSALDLKLRKEMQLELKRLQREMNITFVYVTHDQEEALTMSDTVVVMSGGKIQQIGSPQDIYNEPKNAFVARFIGDSNIVDGVMLKDFLVNFGGHDFTCVDRGFKVNEPVQVVIRPEDVQIVPPSVGMLTGLVREVIFKGVHFEMHVDVEGYEWIIHSTQASQPGELIGMNIGPDEIHIMKRSEV